MAANLIQYFQVTHKYFLNISNLQILLTFYIIYIIQTFDTKNFLARCAGIRVMICQSNQYSSFLDVCFMKR